MVSITLGYLAALAFIYSTLSLIVVILRTKLGIPFGDGGNENLLHAIRAHGNFAEWVPLTVLVVGGLEFLERESVYIHVLMGTLLLARILHPIGLFSRVGTPLYFLGRISGALSTWAILSVAAVFLAFDLWKVT